MSTGGEHLQAWNRATSGLATGDEAALRDVYHPDIEWYDQFFGTLRGADTVASTLAELAGRDFSSVDVEVRRAASEGDTGAVEWVQVLHTEQGDMRMEGVTVLTLTEGRISRWCDYIQPLKNRKP